jgi:flagellar biosynthesis protein FlhG
MVQGLAVDWTSLPPKEGQEGMAAQPRNRIRVISVTSGKGGVGKTQVTANLALALCRMEKRVLILDADLGLANMDVMLGLNPRYSIQHVLKGEKRLEEVLVSAPGGMKLLPAASGIQELTELDTSQRLFLLNELDAIQDRFDVLLIDTAAGISSNVMYFNFAAMEKVVVVTNEPTSLTDAYALIKVLSHKYHQKRFRVLVNAARSEAEANRIYRNLGLVVDQFLGSPSLDYLGWIPYDRMVSSAIRQQQAVLQLYPDTPASKGFVEVARKLMANGEDTSFEGDIRFLWRRLLNV